ncbi:MAG TPA: molybdopterin-dependent oxidoreductase [Caulobacteraceae bacterium]|jgi:DMSO/TMAO reductase YedYZ molybdopterin-dependent catalytic subunit|nr:molybdopterin-dependent oxidoreductase [Caulobacteraceae bacterium]
MIKPVAFALALIATPALADTPPAMPGMSMPPQAPATPTVVTETVVVGPTGKTLVLTPAVLADLDRAQATMINHSVAHTYEGVRLTEILRLVGAPTGARIHADADRDYLVVTGGDGFRAVFSLAETDGSVQRHPVILADKMDGAPLLAHDAPFRLVVDGDQKPARSVYAVSRIEVKVLP